MNLSNLATGHGRVSNAPIDQRNMGPTCGSQDVTRFLSEIWHSPRHHHLLQHFSREGSAYRPGSLVSVHDLTADVAMALKQAPKDGSDLFFACAAFDTEYRRKGDEAIGACALWLDIDCGPKKAEQGQGYESEAAALEALARFCDDIALPRPNRVIYTGGGIHVYWVVDQLVRRLEWKAIADQLKALTTAHGLLADPSRTADITSLMRLPGTLNHKYQPPRPVWICQSSDARLNFESIKHAIATAAGLMPKVERAPVPDSRSPVSISELRSLLARLDPDLDYERWLKVLMAVFHETAGCDEGLALVTEWSSNGTKFRGEDEIRTKWKGFKPEVPNPVTVATLVQMAHSVEVFTPQETEVVPASSEARPTPAAAPMPINPFHRFSLAGQADSLAAELDEQVPLLGRIALMGQLTVLYAAPNTGKTLLVLKLLTDAIESKVVDPSKVFYLNMDDNAQGLVEKAGIADVNGFHMLAEGRNEFTAKKFIQLLEEAIEAGSAKGTVVILDTLKKFINLMDKQASSTFSVVLRRFSMAGGTVVALAHTNKHRSQDGTLRYGGTSDIMEDFDCAYMIDGRNSGDDRVITLTNTKCRGTVEEEVAYRYLRKSGLRYIELLNSVKESDPHQVAHLRRERDALEDADAIRCVRDLLAVAPHSKMDLLEKVRTPLRLSRNAAAALIDRYQGDDPTRHHWNFVVGARGAKTYTLLPQTPLPMAA